MRECKAALCLLLSLLMCGLLLGCAVKDQPLATPVPEGEAAGEGFSLNVCLGEQSPEVIDPSMSEDVDSHSYVLHLYEGLFRYGEDGQITYGVAESHSVSEDGRTWTIRIREDAIWSDGRPLGAKDFVYSWHRLMNPDNQTLYGYDLALYFENGEAVAFGEMPVEELGVKALSQTELEIRLSSPCDYLAEVLAHPCMVPLREGAESDATITNGPYALKSLDEETLLLQRNAAYTGSAPAKAEELRFVFGSEAATVGLGSGAVDFVLSAKSEHESAVNVTALRTGSRVLVFNQNWGSPLKEEALRRALSATVDQEKAARNLGDGSTAATGLVGPGIATEGGSYAVDSAETVEAPILEEPLRFLAYGDEKIVRMAQGIAEDWEREFGIAIKLVTPSFNRYFDEYFAGDYDVALWSVVPDFASPLLFLQDYVSYADNNTFGFSDAQFDALVEAAESEQSLFEAETLLLEQSVLCPLTYYTTQYAKHDSLRGENVLHSGIVLFGNCEP